LESLKSKCEIEDLFILDLFSKRRTVEFKMNIALRTPLCDKEYISISHPKISIIKTFPEFQLPITKELNDYEEAVDTNRITISSRTINQNSEFSSIIDKDSSKYENKNKNINSTDMNINTENIIKTNEINNKEISNNIDSQKTKTLEENNCKTN